MNNNDLNNQNNFNGQTVNNDMNNQFNNTTGFQNTNGLNNMNGNQNNFNGQTVNNDMNNQFNNTTGFQNTNGLNNMNGNQNNFNGQAVNNDMNNQFNNTTGFQNTNGLNNMNSNQNNLYTNNFTNQSETPKKKNTKLLAIIIGIIIAIIVVVVIVFNGSPLGGKKNTTGISGYKGSDVDYNCVYETKQGGLNIKIYTDLIFNYKAPGSETTYQLRSFNKMIVEFENDLTDKKYQDFIDELGSSKCLSANKCTDDHLDLGITSMGWDTIVDRIGDKVEMTYHNSIGRGITASKNDIEETIKQLESEGSICK